MPPRSLTMRGSAVATTLWSIAPSPSTIASPTKTRRLSRSVGTSERRAALSAPESAALSLMELRSRTLTGLLSMKRHCLNSPEVPGEPDTQGQKSQGHGGKAGRGPGPRQVAQKQKHPGEHICGTPQHIHRCRGAPDATGLGEGCRKRPPLQPGCQMRDAVAKQRAGKEDFEIVHATDPCRQGGSYARSLSHNYWRDLSQMSTPPASEARPARRERGQVRVAAIMEAGAALFREKGFEAVTMSDIAARSGTAFGSLYRFFPSKEALADALLLRFAERTLDRLHDLAGRAPTMSPRDVAAALVDFMLE